MDEEGRRPRHSTVVTDGFAWTLQAREEIANLEAQATQHKEEITRIAEQIKQHEEMVSSASPPPPPYSYGLYVMPTSASFSGPHQPRAALTTSLSPLFPAVPLLPPSPYSSPSPCAQETALRKTAEEVHRADEEIAQAKV